MSKRPSIMRSLGRFVGHIARGVSTDVSKPPSPTRTEVSRHVEEETRDAPAELGGGKMTVRRTTIEEIEIESQDDRGA